MIQEILGPPLPSLPSSFYRVCLGLFAAGIVYGFYIRQSLSMKTEISLPARAELKIPAPRKVPSSCCKIVLFLSYVVLIASMYVQQFVWAPKDPFRPE